jgi:sensor c-di-GMP phosphodiesterase-like protein
LTYLSQLPVDILKIDRSFVTGQPGDAESAAVIRAIVRLAHELNLSVVAEGVETPAQADALIALGCDLVQGFHFARPLSSDALLALLQHQRAAVMDARGAGCGTREAATTATTATTAGVGADEHVRPGSPLGRT